MGIIREGSNIQKQAVWTKIKESKYNENYWNIKGEGIPEHLKRGKNMVVRFRKKKKSAGYAGKGWITCHTG